MSFHAFTANSNYGWSGSIFYGNDCMKVCIKRYNDESFFACVFHDLLICCPAQTDIAGVSNLPARIL